MKKMTSTLLLLLACTIGLNAQLFNDKLTTDEQQKLANGKLIIRNIGKVKNISVNKDNPTVERAISTMERLKPAYLAEIIQIMPYNGNENLVEKLRSMLADVDGYVGIPYYSERAEAYYDLYSSANITAVQDDGSSMKMNVQLEMEPFGNIDTDIVMETLADTLYYENMNRNDLRYYDKFTAVKGENMKSIITVFRSGDSWILYGIGGVKAPSIFFLRDRVETSFMNRIKTMCSYFFEQL